MIILDHRHILVGIALLFADMACAEPVPEQFSALSPSSHSPPNSLQLGHSVDHYSRTFEDNPITSLQYGRATQWGTLLLRASDSRRYQNHDTQYEADAYPKLWDGGYAYLNVGTSSGSLFPRNRFGAEIYASFGDGLEGSLGVRHLSFANPVNIYTGSLSRYMGNYLVTFRPYVTPSNAGTSFSASLTTTRYFSDADTYVRVSIGAGKSVEERIIPGSPAAAVTLNSRSAGLSGQWSPRQAIFIAPSLSHERQELLFAPGEYVDVSKFSATMSYRF